MPDLYYNRYRDYDPSTGRYIQADPIGLAGGASPYSYAMNNPLRYTDPTGEFVQILVGYCMLNPTACVWAGAGIAAIGISIYQYYTVPDEYSFYPPEIRRYCPPPALYLDGGGGGRYGGGGIAGAGSDGDDGGVDCYDRWEKEYSNCKTWSYLGASAKRACRDRAANRRNLCVANGSRPNPLEPEEWDPLADWYGE